MKTCPFCAEEIEDAAVVCKHCGRDLDPGATQATATTQAPAKQKTGCASAGCLILILLGLFGYIGGRFTDGGSGAPSSGAKPDPRQAKLPGQSRGAPANALSPMEVAFVGGHSRASIKERLDKAMKLYGLSVTEDHYSRAGSALVALRKQNGVSEMDILDYMIRSHAEGVNMSFPGAAGLSAALLASYSS